MGNNSSKGDKSKKRQMQVKIDRSPSIWQYFGLCQGTERENTSQLWLDHLKAECDELWDISTWASRVISSLKKYKGYPVINYQLEIETCSFKIQRTDNGNRDEEDKKAGVYEQRYKELYRRSELIEEDQHLQIKIGLENGQNRINGNSLNSGYSIASSPSYVFPQYQIQRREGAIQNKDQVEQLELYVIKCERIAEHLTDPMHALCHVINTFEISFLKEYEDIAQILQKHRQEDEIYEGEQLIVKKAVSELQQFIRVTQETLRLFYKLEGKQTYFCRENMLNFVTSQIFKRKRIYELMFLLLRLEDLNYERDLKFAMLKLIHKEPQDFFVQEKLCLNDRTLALFKKRADQLLIPSINRQVEDMPSLDVQYIDCTLEDSSLLEDSSASKKMNTRAKRSLSNPISPQKKKEPFSSSSFRSINSPDKHLIEDEKMKKQLIEESAHNISGSSNSSDSSGEGKKVEREIVLQKIANISQIEDKGESFLEEQKNISNDPDKEENILNSDGGLQRQYLETLKKESYFLSMKYIIKIQKQKSPIGKMKVIVRASEKLITCIDTFYKKYGIDQKHFLDADDVLSIFSFLSCKCLVYNLNTHVNLINKFITGNLLNSVSGYYLTTIAASLQNILEFHKGSFKINELLEDK